jgi:hypothetical protein
MCISHVIKKSDTCHFYRIGWRRFQQLSAIEEDKEIKIYFLVSVELIIGRKKVKIKKLKKKILTVRILVGLKTIVLSLLRLYILQVL